MTNEKIVAILERIADRFRWPFDGEPGYDPDYFDSTEQAAMALACERLRNADLRDALRNATTSAASTGNAPGPTPS